MKITLLYPKWTGEYGLFSHFAKKAGKWPPLNLVYLGAIARNLGHDVSIIDGEAEEIAIEDMVDQTLSLNPDLIGITATTPFYHIAVKLAESLKKKKSIPILIGGPHITVLMEPEFKECFDYAFIGEAEESWPLFLKHFDNGEDVSAIKGILYRKEKSVVFTGPSDPVYNVDAVPVPARDLLKHDKYRLGTLHGNKRFTTIMTVRGCPFKCIFCSTKVFGKNFRMRSPDKVVEEMSECIDKYGTEHFMFLDDTLTLNREHIMRICEFIIEKNLPITFEGSTRANLVDEELIKKMVEAGLIRLSFGLESVDKNIRKIMKKRVPLQSYIDANKITNKYGIETLNSCMIGLPGETVNTIKSTLSFLRDSREIKQANISIAVPYPGTELYDFAIKGEQGVKLLTKDFSKFRRYNASVMQVGSLSPDDLIKLQNDAFASIYLAPWRWRPMIKKSGVIGFLLTFSRLIKSIAGGRFDFLAVDRKFWKLFA